MRIGEHLLKEGLITTEQLDQGLEYQKTHGGRLGSCLVKMGLVSREIVAEFLARKHGVASVDLSSCKPEPDALMLLSSDICMKYRLVPIRCDHSNWVLQVAMVDPGNQVAIDDLKFTTGYKIKPLVALEADVVAALPAFRKHTGVPQWGPHGAPGKCLLVLPTGFPSWEDPPGIQLIAERPADGSCRYFVVQKADFSPAIEKIFEEKPHLLGLFDGSLTWRWELAPEEADEILKLLDALENRALPPVTTMGLDGETHELVIPRGLSRVHFRWWCDPPKGWEPLAKIAQLLKARTEELSARKDAVLRNDTSGLPEHLVKEFREELELARKAIGEAHKEREREEKVKHDARARQNLQCHRLAQQMKTTALRCSICGHESKDFHYVDERPDGWSYFVCRSCGKSFRPGDTYRSST
jgi:hypothetical protein